MEKLKLFCPSVSFCVLILNENRMRSHRRQMQFQLHMQRPHTSIQLQQFICVINWIENLWCTLHKKIWNYVHHSNYVTNVEIRALGMESWTVLFAKLWRATQDAAFLDIKQYLMWIKCIQSWALNYSNLPTCRKYAEYQCWRRCKRPATEACTAARSWTTLFPIRGFCGTCGTIKHSWIENICVGEMHN